MKKRLFIILSILSFMIASYLLYIGNYIYDYTLNPHAKEKIFDIVDIDQTNLKKAKEWLNQYSEDCYIENDQLLLHSYFIKQKSHVYVMIVHGYNGDGVSMISAIKHMYKWKYNLLVPDLRGHGHSEGNYIGMGYDDARDIRHWIDFIIQQDKLANIFLYGVSMGGAAVLNVSGQTLPHQVKGIIEDSGYSNALDIYKEHMPVKGIARDIALSMLDIVTNMKAGYKIKDVQPLKQVKKSCTPILFIHGSDDELVPINMVYSLYKATSASKELLIIQNAHHSEGSVIDTSTYYYTVHNFIKKYAKQQ